MSRDSSAASPANPPELFDYASAAFRSWMLDLPGAGCELAVPVHCQLTTANRQRTKARFEPHLNYSRSRDALILRVHGLPRFLDSGPPSTAKKAFEPDLNYSRSRDAALPFYLNGWPRIAAPHSQGGSCPPQPQKAGAGTFDPHSNYSRSRDGSTTAIHSLLSIFYFLPHFSVTSCPRGCFCRGTPGPLPFSAGIIFSRQEKK
jgi:hypothetical protein